MSEKHTLLDQPLVLSLSDMEMVLLVDYKPGSKLDLRLTEIERKLDHIFALLVAGQPTGEPHGKR